MAKIASQPNRINYRSWETGQVRGFSNLYDHKKRFGAPYWQVFRPDYHAILLEAAIEAGANLRRGCTVISYDVADGAVILESGERVKGDLIVGADGVKSIARKIVGQNVDPHETGDTCFRAVIPGSVLLADPDLAPLVRTPGFEQWLGPDHHIIGFVKENCCCSAESLHFLLDIICRKRRYTTC
jgi:salicylate hydroxylase